MYKASSFINGIPIFASEEITIRKPIDNSVIGSVPKLNREQILSAFSNSKEAFKKWREVDHNTKAKFLLSFAEKLKQHACVLSQITSAEIGKNVEDVNKEINRSVEYIIESVHAYMDIMEKPEEYNYEKNILIPKDISGTYLRVPWGVALTISPFNYPINLMITKIVPAILSGNTVVHKSATQGSLTGWYITKVFHEISVDDFSILPGVLNYITGRGSDISEIIMDNSNFDIFSFTGGTSVGRELAKKISFKPIQLELGGNNPAIVLKDADLSLCVPMIIKGALNFSGQRCTAIKKAFVHKSIFKKFIFELDKQLKEFGKLKDPLINKSSIDKTIVFYDDAISKGAKSLTGPLNIKGNFLDPIVLIGVNKDMKVFKEELFSPIISILEFEKIEELYELVNTTEYGLQAAIFSKDLDLSAEIALKLEFGRININRIPARSPDIMPFSADKNSGFEVQGIKNSIYFFTKFKGIVLQKSE